MQLVNNLDFNKYEARNMKLQNLATAPASPTVGQAYFDTTLGQPRVWDGTAWKDMVGAAGTVTSVTGAAPITSTGGTTPQIGITPATSAAAGSMSAADKAKLDGIASGATAIDQLTELVDVTVTTPGDYNALVYRSAAARWENVALSLDVMADVQKGTAANGQFLILNGADQKWYNQIPQISHISGLQTALDNKSSSMHSHSIEELDDVVFGSFPVTGAFLWYNDQTMTWDWNVPGVSDISGLSTALAAKLDDTQRGAANGVASLGADGKVPSGQLPSIAFTNVTVVASLTERDALTGMAEGDVAIVNGDRSYIYDGTAWQELDSATDGVQTVTAGTGITIGGTATSPSVGITNGGVGATQLATGVAGNGLTGGGGAALAVGAGTGISVAADTVGIANGGVGVAQIATAVAGNGLTGGGGAALAVGAGTGISVTADAVAINTAVVVRKAAFAVGDGTATSFVLTHNLNTRDVTTSVYRNTAPYDEVLADVEHTDLNTITVRFAAAPAASAFRVVVHG